MKLELYPVRSKPVIALGNWNSSDARIKLVSGLGGIAPFESIGDKDSDIFISFATAEAIAIS
jgi:hypothetical protein